MSPDTDANDVHADRGLHKIPKWARRYAQNRTLPIVANLVVFLAGFLAIGGLSYLAGWGYVTGRRPVAAVAVVLLAAFVVFWMWFSFVGGKHFERWATERLYRGEGHVAAGAAPVDIAKGPAPVVGGVFGFCILAHVGLGFIGVLPIRLMQPVSALYVVPFILYLAATQRGANGGSPFMLLWPALYAIHAALVVAGVPIQFGGGLEALNVLVPTVGYGLLSALAGHVYSRFALRRLKALTRSPEAEATEGGRSS